MMKKLLLIILLFVFCKGYSQTHIYKFNGVLDDSGGGGGPTLTEVLDVTSGCIPNGTAGAFASQMITTSSCTRGPQQVFSFNQNSGLSYPNTTFIGGTYTIHMLYKIDDFTLGSFSFQRVIDFKNSVTDDGLYTRDKGGGVGTLAYANGGVATNITSTLTAGQYYLITLVRDASALPNPTFTVYLDGTAVSAITDVAGLYASASSPIIFFMDDQSAACETSTGSVRYISLENAASDATAVQATWITICNGLLKPNLNSFTAQKNNSDARLQWQTGNETNTSYFDIERSYNGQTYTAIGRVSAAHASGSNTYNYTDQAVFSSSNVNAFYRLKIVDNNGSYEHSSVVKLTNNKNSKITLFPNPATDALSISGLHNTDIIRLISIDGKVLLQRNAGAESVIMHIEKYNRGTYIIQVQNGKEVIQQKFVKR